MDKKQNLEGRKETSTKIKMSHENGKYYIIKKKLKYNGFVNI